MLEKKKVILALGSNCLADKHLQQALAKLSHQFTAVTRTPILRTAPIGIKSEDFYNCLVTLETAMAEETLQKCLKNLEKACGDTREQRAQGKIIMDIDLLEYDGERRHLADWQRPYITQLMQELNTK